jgi:hypothetical protein
LGGRGIWIEYFVRSTPTRIPSSMSVGETWGVVNWWVGVGGGGVSKLVGWRDGGDGVWGWGGGGGSSWLHRTDRYTDGGEPAPPWLPSPPANIYNHNHNHEELALSPSPTTNLAICFTLITYFASCKYIEGCCVRVVCGTVARGVRGTINNGIVARIRSRSIDPVNRSIHATLPRPSLSSIHTGDQNPAHPPTQPPTHPTDPPIKPQSVSQSVSQQATYVLAGVDDLRAPRHLQGLFLLLSTQALAIDD